MPKTSIQLIILVLIVLVVGQNSVASLTDAKENFLRSAAGIDLAAATAMADNLTDADWYEVDSAFLLDALRATLEARQRFAWASKVPEDIYRRYVVPLRVSGEPLQPFRRKFLNEIGPRLDGLDSLARAALEVNLYLGERVGFKRTDRRDQGPLTTLSAGFGRCEEEMILAVDAMRSVGIPARGVWVPYWSASNNNHVWLEVYTEDGWKYLGAAEPATRLNKAWFDKALQRAGILLTMAADYKATDADAVKTGSGYSLNVTRNYMAPAKLTVEMPKNWGKEDHLWFALFNFGGLQPLVELVPRQGTASLEIGNGDFTLMGIHAGRLFFQTFTAQLRHETRVRLDVSKEAPQDFTLTYPWPPATGKKEPDLLAPQRIKQALPLRKQRNAERNRTGLLVARSLREGGILSQALEKTLQRSGGNEATVAAAVQAVPLQRRDQAIFILSLLWDKDLREVNAAVLSRWLQRTPPGSYAGNEEFKALVLNPQIGYEYPGTGLPDGYATEPVKFASLDGLRRAVARYSSLVDVDEALIQRQLPPVTIDRMLADGVPVSAGNAALWWTDRLRRSGVPAKRALLSDWLEFYHEGKWLPLYPPLPDKLGDRSFLPDVRAHYQEPATVKLQWRKTAAAPKWKSDFLFLPLQHGLPDYRRDSPKAIKTGNNATEVTLEPGRYLFTAGRRNGRGDVAVQVRLVDLGDGDSRSMTLDLLPPPEPPAENRALRLRDLQWQPATAAGKHLLIVLGDNEPSERVRHLAEEIREEGLRLDFVDDINRLSPADRKKLGLESRDAADTPFVYFFDQNGALLFTQSGYDLNLPNRVRNTMR